MYKMMTGVKPIKRLAACVIAASVIIAPRPSSAEFVVTLDEIGGNVIATGTGSIDLFDLAFARTGAGFGGMIPDDGDLGVGSGSYDIYTGYTGPASFGPGGLAPATATTGPLIGLGDGFFYVPDGYVSGTALSNSDVFSGATLTSLGVTPGTYTWTWGSGQHADSFTLEVPVPEPASALLISLPIAGMLLARRRSKRM